MSPAAAHVFNPICLAIRERRLLELDYGGLHRIVAPYCHGLSRAGLESLRAIQVGGKSRSPAMRSGKLWTVQKITNMTISEQTFTPDDPSYQPDDSAMASIHCRIEAHAGRRA